MEGEAIYNCKTCNYVTNQLYLYNKHISSKKHSVKTGEKPDKSLIKECPECDYTTNIDESLKIHILNQHASEEERIKEYKHYCYFCGFGSNYQTKMNVHEKSKKHQRRCKSKNKKKTDTDESSDSESN